MTANGNTGEFYGLTTAEAECMVHGAAEQVGGRCGNEQHQLGGPAARGAGGAALGAGFVGSLTMGAGQFCTNPGLLLAVDGPGADAFVAAAGTALAGTQPSTMLTPGIFGAYRDGVARLSRHRDVPVVTDGKRPP